MQRTRAEKARAIARVEADGAVPMSELVLLVGADEKSLIRYATDGNRGVHLDAICRAGKWFSSRLAAGRFLGELGRADEAMEEARLAEPRGDGPPAAQPRPHFVMGAAARVTRPRPSPTAASAGRSCPSRPPPS